MTELRALFVVSVACAGCATTSGRDWLDAPLDQHAMLNAETVEAPPASVEARPRLSHTVTLGEAYASDPAPAAAASGGPTVQVNVQTHVPIVINNYGAYGAYGAYGYGASSTARGTPVRSSGGTPTKVGGDFPAPPDYGPRALR